MAKLSINIVNPVINLITNIEEVSNSCKTLFSFDSLVPSGDSIKLSFVQAPGSPYSYDKAEIIIDGVTQTIVEGQAYVLSNGKSSTQVTIGNAPSVDMEDCNEVDVTVTHVEGGGTKTFKMTRCNTNLRC